MRAGRFDFLEAFFPEELSEIEPPDRLMVTEWADRYRILEPSTSAEPGPWRTDRIPYARAWMDAFNDPDVECVVIQSATQVGKTETLLNILGYIIDQQPGPTMVVYPTVEVAEDVSRTRIQPMIEAHPRLAEKRVGDRHRFTTLRMQFAGMDLYLSGANSAASLASKPCEYVLLDEVNKYPTVLQNEADPVSLAVERTKTFLYSRKIMIASTPTTEQGRITRELEDCDAVYEYQVPCPHCGVYQPLVFAQVKWPQCSKDDPDRLGRIEELAHYECAKCGGTILDHHKPGMLRAGRWQAAAEPGRRRKIGFRLSSLYSPWVKFGKLAVQFLRSKDDPAELQNVVNGWFGEPWIQRYVKVDDDQVLQARCDLPPQTVPREAVALTCGIDRQQTGFYFVVRAWARDMTSWLVHYGFLPSWEDVEQLLFDTAYPVVGMEGMEMPIWRAAIDTAGTLLDDASGISATEDTYLWLRKNGRGRGCQVWGTKGSSYPLQGKLRMSKPLDRLPSGKPIPGGLTIVLLDTDKLKDAFWWRLERARKREGAGAAYLHSGTGRDYSQQILAEEKRLDRKGREEWVRIRKDNHYLDAELIAAACADPEWLGGVRLLVAPARVGGARTGRRRIVPEGPTRPGLGARVYERPSWLNR